MTPNGTLFGSGWGYDTNGIGHALIMASPDGGSTWSAPLDDFTYAPGDSASYSAVASDSAGILYAAGEIDDAGGNANWFVRRSSDGGLTWSTVDLLSSGTANKVAADSSGDLFVAGTIAGHWVVRKGFGGTNFTTVDSFPAGLFGAHAVFVHPTAGILAAGNAPISTNTVKSGKTVTVVTNYGWVVRRSTNGGATWATIDAFALPGNNGTPPWYGAIPFDIGADGHGNLYVVGSANTVSGGGPFKTTVYSHWVVRKSADGGNSWTTVDNTFSLAGGVEETAGAAFVADATGNLFVAGYSVFDWIVRENPGGNGTWQTVDDFKYAAGARASGITADTSGHVFVGGYGWNNTDSTDHWLVRKH